ncbi:MAG: hypothetical protein R3223_10760, partial [Longimicrobiales bacterium]|nr:hypothetical protein [Longimicrobiales bacterium]
FFQKDSGLRPPEPPMNMRVAMGIFAFACIFLGVYPDPLYAILPYPVDYEPYTVNHLVSQFQLLLFAGLAFFVMLPMMKRTETISLDFDWLYRKLGSAVVGRVTEATATGRERTEAAVRSRIDRILQRLFEIHGPHGPLARTWPTGSMVLWVAVLLGAFLLFYYI